MIHQTRNMLSAQSSTYSSFEDNCNYTDMDLKPYKQFDTEFLDVETNSMEDMIFTNLDQTVPDLYTPSTTFDHYMSGYNTPPAQAAPITGTDRMISQSYTPISYGSDSYMPVTVMSQSIPTSVIATAGEPQAQPAKPRRKGGRKPKNDPLPPHLEERRRLRRIRNREAAQKVRERRVLYSDELAQEIAELEQQTRQTEQLIESLRETKEQCEFMLSSHNPHCLMSNRKVIPSLSFTNNCAIEHRRVSSSSNSSPDENLTSLLLI